MKNRIILTGVIALILGTCAIQAQTNTAINYFDERYVYSQPNFNPVLLNPGAIAQSGEQTLLIDYRDQWSSFSGAPKTITLSYDGQLVDRLGINVLVLRDNFASLQTSKAQLGFSYRIESATNKIGFGLTGEYVRQGLNNYGLTSSTINESDPVIKARRAGVDYIDASFGVYGIFDNKFTYGLALPSLISSRLTKVTNSDDKRELGVILNVGYKIKSTAGINLHPAVWLKKLQGVPTHIDLNLAADFLDERLLAGLNYRIGADQGLGFNIGAKIDRVAFLYNYNVSNRPFQEFNNGAHEIVAKITIGNKKMKDDTNSSEPMMMDK